VINISTDTGKRQSRWPQAEDQQPRPPTTARPADRAGGRSLGVRIRAALAFVGTILGNGLGDVTRRLGYRLFAMNDDEACWRGWQIIQLYGGLGRRYRDPRFYTLAECARCRGAGVNGDAPCVRCLGTGRVTVGGVS
jgi:hypothetical protein